ncbi:MAG: hypothetical protein NUV47_03580 [Patescibacteria group bacterium]|nr:hypothetical protein [Patescibacteria group bacterium]
MPKVGIVQFISILQWYWNYLTNKIGSVHKVLIVDDPYCEVFYTPDFLCTLRKNNYLSEDVIQRVISESQGVLQKNTSLGKSHHPSNTLMMVKRRRKIPHWVAPSIYGDDNGTLFYRMTARSQISHNGEHIRSRKIRLVRLQAKNVPNAVKEIVKDGLFDSHMRQTAHFKNNGFRSLVKRYAL